MVLVASRKSYKSTVCRSVIWLWTTAGRPFRTYCFSSCFILQLSTKTSRNTSKLLETDTNFKRHQGMELCKTVMLPHFIDIFHDISGGVVGSCDVRPHHRPFASAPARRVESLVPWSRDPWRVHHPAVRPACVGRSQGTCPTAWPSAWPPEYLRVCQDMLIYVARCCTWLQDIASYNYFSEAAKHVSLLQSYLQYMFIFSEQISALSTPVCLNNAVMNHFQTLWKRIESIESIHPSIRW